MTTQDTIQSFVSAVAKQYMPEKIILFGSYARGQMYAGSDVDLLVVLDHKTRNVEKAIEILNEISHHFPLDLLVRKPTDITRRIEMNDLFIREIVEQGKILYEAGN
jgi:predicted nucleotidyltransferase